MGKQTGTSTRRNRTAAELGEAMAKSDELADAVTSGELSTDQAAAAVGAAGGEALDAEVIEAITDLPLPAVKLAVEDWRARQHPDRDADLADTQRARRHLRVTDHGDGMTRVEGLLDPESGAIVRSTLDGIMNLSAFDGTKRTRDQRCADALTQLCSAASKGQLKGGRSNTKLIAIAPFETIVERAAARGITHVGPTLDPATVRRLACDAGIHRLVTGPGSSILDFGHENRLVSDNLFLALVARDQRCRWLDSGHLVRRPPHRPPRRRRPDQRRELGAALSPPPPTLPPTRLEDDRHRRSARGAPSRWIDRAQPTAGSRSARSSIPSRHDRARATG